MKASQLNTYTTKELNEIAKVIKNLIKFRKDLSKMLKTKKITIDEIYKKRGTKPKWIKEIMVGVRRKK